MSTSPDRASNRIALLREAAGLTARGLAERIATSPEQIERWEAGETINPGHIPIIALALAVAPEALFPNLSSKQPASPAEWKALGFDLEASTFTWEVSIRLRGHNDVFVYIVDEKVALHFEGILCGKCDFEFLTFDSNGRRIFVSVRDIQSVTVGDVLATLTPGASYTVAKLDPSCSELRLYLRDHTEPIQINAMALNNDDLEEELSRLAWAKDVQSDFIQIRNEFGDHTSFRVAEIALIEQPLTDLLDEMGKLPEEFWDSTA